MGQKATAWTPAGPPESLVVLLRDSLGMTHFIEGGTFHARTARWAAEHFPQVITIEASPPVYERIRPLHRQHPTIQFLQGDTRQLLPGIVDSLRHPACFWLDSHWSVGDTFGEHDECPVLAELSIINRSPLDHVVLIDDARLFMEPPPPPHDVNAWPTLTDICQAAGMNDRFLLIVDDVIIAVPGHQRPLVLNWHRNRHSP